MVIMKITGNSSSITFHTDKSAYIGAGELCVDGFAVWNKSIKDENNMPITEDMLQELILSVEQYTTTEHPRLHIYFIK